MSASIRTNAAQIAKLAAERKVEIRPYHTALANACDVAARAVAKLGDTLRATLESRYGDCLPNHAQYTEDQSALAVIAEARGLSDNQYYRKAYAGAVAARYGCLPVSVAQGSLDKAAQRRTPAQTLAYDKAMSDPANADAPDYVKRARAAHAAAQVKAVKAAPVGAPAGEAKPQTPSVEESISQFVARHGIFPILAEINKILASVKDTQLQAKTLAAVADQVREIVQKKAA